MLKLYSFILCMVLGVGIALAGKTNADTGAHIIYKHTVIDTGKILTRNFNPEALKQYTADKDFQYQSSYEGLSFLERLWLWFQRLFSSDGYNETNALFYKYLFITLAAVIIILIILKYNQINFMSVFRRESNKSELPYSESLENIHEINFDNEIERAIGIKNYRLAVRLLYLRSLKQLSDAQLIHWQIEKTNSAYLSELTDAEQRQTFGLLTTQFEYIWYGDFPIDGNSFEYVNTLFHNFRQKLSS